MNARLYALARALAIAIGMPAQVAADAQADKRESLRHRLGY